MGQKFSNYLRTLEGHLLEDLRMKLEDMGSSISINQCMIHVLNNLTSDHDLQLALMEKRGRNRKTIDS
jgi:hypothetical protein